MTLRLRVADCPQTAFVEASGDLRAPDVHRCENTAGNPVEPVSRVALAPEWSQIRLSKLYLRPGNQSQDAIQYP
jgi:hypothetical protein